MNRIEEPPLLYFRGCGKLPEEVGVVIDRTGKLVGMFCPSSLPRKSHGLPNCMGVRGSGIGGERCIYAASHSGSTIHGRTLTAADPVSPGFPREQLTPESRLMYFLLTECDRISRKGFIVREGGIAITQEQLTTSGVAGNLFGLDGGTSVTLNEDFLHQLEIAETLRDVASTAVASGEDGMISFPGQSAETFQDEIIQNHHLITVSDRPGEFLLFANHGGIALECGTAEKADDPLYVRLDPASVRTLEECAMIDMFPLASMGSTTPVKLPQYGRPLDDPMQIFTNSDLIHYVLRNFRMEFDEPEKVFFTRRGKSGSQPILFEDLKDYLPSPGLEAIRNGLKEKGLDYKDARLPALSPQHKLAFIKLARREQAVRDRERAEEQRRDEAITEILSSYSLKLQPNGQLLLNRHAPHLGGNVPFAIGASGLKPPGIVLRPGESPISLTDDQIEELRICAENFALINCIGYADKAVISQRLIALFHIDGNFEYNTGVLNFRLRPGGPILFTNEDLRTNTGARTNCPSIRGMGFEVADINRLKSASRIRVDVNDTDVVDFDDIKGPIQLGQWVKCNFRSRIVDGEYHFIPRSDRVVPEPYKTRGLTEDNLVGSGDSPDGIKLTALQFFALGQWADNEGMSEVRLEGTPRAGNGVARYRIFETLRDPEQAQLSFGRSGHLFYKAMLPVPEGSKEEEREESKELREVRFFQFRVYEEMLRDVAGFRGIKA